MPTSASARPELDLTIGPHLRRSKPIHGNGHDIAMTDRVLSPDEIARINKEHLIATSLKPSDLLFVFGTRDGAEQRIDAAYSIWRGGYCWWLLVSGGMTPGGDLTECQIIKTGLVSRGVLSERI